MPFPNNQGFFIRAITETAPDIMGAVDVGVGVAIVIIGVAVIVGVAVTVTVGVTVAVTVGAGVGVPACCPTHPDNKIASPTTVMKMIGLNCTILTSIYFTTYRTIKVSVLYETC